MKTADVRVCRAIASVAAGRAVVVTDTDNDGYLAFAADAATTQLLAFTVRHTAGLVKVALPAAECGRLNLPPMCHPDGDRTGSAHRVAVDWHGTGTGISATDRARTISALAAQESTASDFRRPGHVLTLQSCEGGVLVQRGAAEAGVDLAYLAGRRPAAVLCEIVSRDRPVEMARGAELVEFAVEHGLAIVSIAELVAYRRRTEPQVVRSAEALIPTSAGNSRAIGFRDVHCGGEHLAVIIGAAGGRAPVPLHVHVECLTGDLFGSTACRCGGELDSALSTMTARGGGVIVYLRPPGRVHGCGLFGGTDSVPTDYVSETVAWILRDLGVYTVRLSDDTSGFGLVMFGAIRDSGQYVNGGDSAACRVAG